MSEPSFPPAVSKSAPDAETPDSDVHVYEKDENDEWVETR